MNRMSVIVCYSQNGEYNDSTYYLVKSLTAVSDTYVVINGNISDESLKIMNSYTGNIIVRENIGFDVLAFKYAIFDAIGLQSIREYDELILMNDTVYGPLYSFDELFKKMNDKKCDFWGITSHKGLKDPWGFSENGYLPEHIQSYFIVYRKKILDSADFENFWYNQKEYGSIGETITFYETALTKYYSELGYTWDVLVDMSDIDADYSEGTNHYFVNHYELLKRGSIFYKKKNIHPEILEYNNSEDTRKSIQFIRHNTDFDCNLIFNDLIRKYDVSDLYNILGLQFNLPAESKYNTADILGGKRALVIVHIYYIGIFKEISDKIGNIPDPIDVLITTDSDEKMDIIRSELSDKLQSRLKVKKSTIGRDIGSLLICCKDEISDYDYVCFTHDKRSPQAEYIIGKNFLDIIVNNVIDSEGYINNVLEVMKENPHIGVLSTPQPKMGDYFLSVGNGWTMNYGGVIELSKKLNLDNVLISPEKQPLCLGFSFWFRPTALKQLFEVDWSDSLDIQALPVDGSLPHHIERIIPFVAQENLYYSGIISTQQYSEMECIRCNYILNKMVRNIRTHDPSNDGFSFEEFNDKINVNPPIVAEPERISKSKLMNSLLSKIIYVLSYIRDRV